MSEIPQSKRPKLSDDAEEYAACEAPCSEDDDDGLVHVAAAIVEDDAVDASATDAQIEGPSGTAAATRFFGAREVDVGITEYATSSSHVEPIAGVLKQRYCDFVVNEIALSGEVVHLTSTDDIDKPEKSALPTEVEATAVPCPFSVEDIELLKQLNTSKDSRSQVKLTASADKHLRTEQHGYVRRFFPLLQSTCVQDGEQKYLVVTQARANGGDPRNAAGARWPKDRPKYLHFVLYKEFKDTMEAVDVVSKYAGLRPHAFTYAGTKDKRARTTQQVAVHRVEASRLQRVNACLQNMAVGNFSYKDQPLRLGDLRGNRFGIVLRQLTASEAAVARAMDCLQSTGFVNYYGMQRFGTGSVATHAVGKKLLRGDYAGAVDLVLGERAGDRPAVAAARHVWSTTGDARATLAALPRSSPLERRLAEGLVRHQCSGCRPRSDDPAAAAASAAATTAGAGPQQQQDRWRRALECLPRGTRLMYAHSYQSYVWNRIASQRVRELGLKPVIGDLVVKPKDLAHSNEQLERGVLDDRSGKWSVELLECADQLGKYSIYDVCLPLPGYDVVYPAKEVKNWYEAILKEDGMTFDSFRSKSKDYSLPGSYRMLIVKPIDLTWRLQQYDDLNQPLIESDLDRLAGRRHVVHGNRQTALVTEFSLPASSYATMALREVMRSDTSSAHQSTLNSTTVLPPISDI